MAKWIRRVAVALLFAVVATTCIGMYATWKDCTDRGGKTVRGLFGLECIV